MELKLIPDDYSSESSWKLFPIYLLFTLQIKTFCLFSLLACLLLIYPKRAKIDSCGEFAIINKLINYLNLRQPRKPLMKMLFVLSVNNAPDFVDCISKHKNAIEAPGVKIEIEAPGRTFKAIWFTMTADNLARGHLIWKSDLISFNSTSDCHGRQ